jgi:hypothetical protein
MPGKECQIKGLNLYSQLGRGKKKRMCLVCRRDVTQKKIVYRIHLIFGIFLGFYFYFIFFPVERMYSAVSAALTLIRYAGAENVELDFFVLLFLVSIGAAYHRSAQ